MSNQQSETDAQFVPSPPPPLPRNPRAQLDQSLIWPHQLRSHPRFLQHAGRLCFPGDWRRNAHDEPRPGQTKPPIGQNVYDVSKVKYISHSLSEGLRNNHETLAMWQRQPLSTAQLTFQLSLTNHFHLWETENPTYTRIYLDLRT